MAGLRLKAHRYTYIKKEMPDETHCFGRSANMRVTQKVSRNSDAEFKTLIDRYSSAWSSLNPDKRRGGKWLIVHEHFSAPLPG